MSRRVHASGVSALVAVDDAIVSCGFDGRVCTSRSEDLELIASARLTTRWANAIAVLPGESVCAVACGDGTVQKYVPGATKVATQVRLHSDWVLSAAFRSDAKTLLSGGRDRRVIVSDWNSGRQVYSLRASYWVQCLAIAEKQQRVAAGCWDGTVWLWSLGDKKLVYSAQVLAPHHAVTCLEFSDDGESLYAAGQSPVAMRLSTTDLEVELRFVGHEDFLCAMYVLSDVLVTASNDGTIRSWNIENGEVLERVSPGIGPFTCMALAHDGTSCFVGNSRGTIARTALPKVHLD